MSNRYFDRFIYAIDSNNKIHLMEDDYYAALGCAYREIIRVSDKTYVVYTAVDDLDMATEKQGHYLPLLNADDCCSFFSDQTSSNMLRVIKEAALDKTDIVKMVYLDFERTSWSIYAAEGWVITKDGKTRIDSPIFEKVISTDADVEMVADNIVRQLI